MHEVLLPGFLDGAPPMAKVSPILRYPGGKAWLTKTLCPGIYHYLAGTRGRYCEPFFGGGAIGLWLGLPRMVLTDVSEPIMIMYAAIREKPVEVAAALASLVLRGTSEETYYAVRDERPQGSVQQAARILYLNRVCYNGVMRFNKDGEYNVPFGKPSANGHASFPTVDKIVAVSRAIHDATIGCSDFGAKLLETQKGDLVYADPPYYGTFAGYSAGGFSRNDQEDLAGALRDAHEDGVVILSTNSDCEEVRKLYSWAFITPISERRSVSQDTKNRKRVGCVLISNRFDLLEGL